MWTLSVRLGLVELFTAASLLLVAGLLAIGLANGWEIAIVPALTYALAISATYVLYRRYVGVELAASRPAAAPVRFQVVGARGVCPLGHREGDVVMVGAAGMVTPPLCEPARAVLRLAAGAGRESEVQKWCCPVYDHMLVFRRERQAA